MALAIRVARTASLLCAFLAITPSWGATVDDASPLLAIDRNRDAVVERIVAQWGDALVRSNAGLGAGQLREMLLGMRSDQLLAASLVGNLEGLRNVVAAALVSDSDVRSSMLYAKALGDASQDVVYVPVTPCRLVETRGTFAAVYQGGGPFAPNEVRTYTLQGGNGVCLAQLPGSVTPSAVQMQVYGIPTTAGSGDIEILPQGGAFGSTATLVYLGSNAFTSASSTTLANLANKQISVQVRGGGAHVAIDVVGYFRAPAGGYVSSVTAGTGLTGGGTGAVTLNVDTAAIQSRVTGTCAAGSSIRAIAANGTVTCETDDVGTGTVTSVGTGTGLTGGPITGTGTINLAATNLLPTPACATNQIPKWNGTAWACAADANSGGTVTSITAGAGLTGGVITTSGTIAVDPASSTLTGNFFRQGGNAFGATAVLGTTDDNAIDIRANGSRVMRYEPNAISPNVIGGSPANSVTAGVRGATIAGGGVPSGNTDPLFLYEAPNRVTDMYGTVAGGYANAAGSDDASPTNGVFASVGGGVSNTASGNQSTVAGGGFNTASGDNSTVAGGNGNDATGGVGSAVGGGVGNTASGQSSTVAGGSLNTASGGYSTVAGGVSNTASQAWSMVGGGSSNRASGQYSAVPGGDSNTASGSWSFAAGRRAKTQTADATPILHSGTFAFADAQNFDFHTTVNNEFAIRVTGGARFVTAVDGTGNPTRTVKINPNGEVDFGSQERQMLNLWGPANYGIGVQAFTLYSRTDGAFAWFLDGVHSNSANDPGAGGSVLATLQAGASGTTVVGTFRAQAFTATSDREAKTGMAAADTSEVLDKVLSLPISTWAYKTEEAAGYRHIGPTAQDFHARFGVGYDDKSITTVDADGVALAAIQGLNDKLEAKVADQAREIAALKRAVEALLARAAREEQIAAR
ncbi:MAG: tail fiber domain-containing protein [Burkholderiales bacterium]